MRVIAAVAECSFWSEQLLLQTARHDITGLTLLLIVSWNEAYVNFMFSLATNSTWAATGLLGAMKGLSKALGIGLRVIGACTKTAAAVSNFIISKVIGAGGSVTIQSLLLASNACFLYAGEPPFPTSTSTTHSWKDPGASDSVISFVGSVLRRLV